MPSTGRCGAETVLTGKKMNIRRLLGHLPPGVMGALALMVATAALNVQDSFDAANPKLTHATRPGDDLKIQ